MRVNEAKRKVKMYKKIVSNMEQGRYVEQPEDNELFDRLYDERKTWSQPKQPKQFKIRVDSIEPSLGRATLTECFKNLKLKKRTFDPSNPKDFFQEKYTGGPTSNILKENEIDQVRMTQAALLIQRLYKIWKAKKEVMRMKLEKERQARLASQQYQQLKEYRNNVRESELNLYSKEEFIKQAKRTNSDMTSRPTLHLHDLPGMKGDDVYNFADFGFQPSLSARKP